eukprot:m.74521 g.74521  ORF g.74521 m.74521 type:complete len:963 (+) comp8919_c0_seq2:76-2964(+)
MMTDTLVLVMVLSCGLMSTTHATDRDGVVSANVEASKSRGDIAKTEEVFATGAQDMRAYADVTNSSSHGHIKTVVRRQAATPPPGCSAYLQDIDYAGNDMPNGGVGVSSATACANACLQFSGCTHWTYLGTTCYRKSSGAGYKTVPTSWNCISGSCNQAPTVAPSTAAPVPSSAPNFAPTAPPTFCTANDDTIYSGTTLSYSFTNPNTLTGCNLACASLDACTAYVFSGTTCTLMQGTFTSSSSTGSIAGSCNTAARTQVRSLTTPLCSYTSNIDYAGSDIAQHILTTDYNGCAALCISISNCVYFTYAWNKCFLKTVNALSGYKTVPLDWYATGGDCVGVSVSSLATSAPATAAPITAAPITAAPITAAPVTDAPITNAPVTGPTAPPTTAVPTTATPTDAPTTTSPTTATPTDAPTTLSPTTATPTVVPTTAQPTATPVTAAPVTLSYVSVFGCCRTASGTHGTLIIPKFSTTLATCKYNCDIRSACIAYEYGSGDKCEIHSETITQTEGNVCTCYIKNLVPTTAAPLAPTEAPTSAAPTVPQPTTMAPTAAPVAPTTASSYTQATLSIGSASNGANIGDSYAEAQGYAKNGKLYVFGGFKNGWNKLAKTTFQYTPSSNSWTQLTDIPMSGYDGVSHMGNAEDPATDMIYLAGGLATTTGGSWPGGVVAIKGVYGFNTNTLSWSTLPQLPNAVGGNGAVVLNGNLHVIGGAEFTGSQGGFQNDVNWHYMLDLSNQGAGWSTKASISVGRNHIGVAAGPDNKIYAIGGQHLEEEGCTNFQLVEAYNPSTNTWQTRASLPLGIGHISPSTLGTPHGVVVFAGVTDKSSGCGPPGVHVNKIHTYDPISNTWSAINNPAGGASRVTGIINGAFYSQHGSGISIVPLTWTAKSGKNRLRRGVAPETMTTPHDVPSSLSGVQFNSMMVVAAVSCGLVLAVVGMVAAMRQRTLAHTTYTNGCPRTAV